MFQINRELFISVVSQLMPTFWRNGWHFSEVVDRAQHRQATAENRTELTELAVGRALVSQRLLQLP